MLTESVDDWAAEAARDAQASKSRGGRPTTNGSGRLRKLECGSCGFIARASAGAIRNVGLPTCACGTRMHVPELRDLEQIDAEAFEEASTAEEAPELERLARAESRRAARDANLGFETRAKPCAVCGRFKSRPADRCGYCGDEPAQHGRTDAEQRANERTYNRGQNYAA